MKYAISLFVTLIVTFFANAQITGPDTVCLNTQTAFSTTYDADSYTWQLDTITKTISGIRTPVAGGTGAFQHLHSVKMIMDNGQYHAFVNSISGNINRLDFGNNPMSIPVSTYSPNVGFNYSRGIDIVKDPVTGQWHGVMSHGNKILLLDFGNSITNNYTITPLLISTNLAVDFNDVILKKYNNHWLVFTADPTTRKVVKIDLGTSLSNPVPVSYSYTDASIYSPQRLTLYEENNDWYLFALDGNNLIRMDFGNDLLNNTPSFTNLGNFSGVLNYVHEFVLFSNCNQLFGLAVCDNKHFILLDFNGSITNTPTVTDLGYIGSSPTQTYNYSPFVYGNNISAIGVTADDSAHIISLMNIVGYTQTKSNLSPFNCTFSTSGLHTVNMVADLGQKAGNKFFCKDVYVRPALPINITVGATSLTVNTPAIAYQWNLFGNPIPGATNSIYTPTQSGDYTVTIIDASGCSSTSAITTFLVNVGVTDVQPTNNLHVYPNPSKGEINIFSDNLPSAHVILSFYNTLGLEVYREPVDIYNNKLHIKADLSKLPRGIYEMRVQTANAPSYIKHIILQ